MAKIKFKLKNNGFTLIEILVYIGIFSIIFVIINLSVFYLQKIIQNNNQNYYIKNQIYFNLNVLQQYLFKNNIIINNDGLNLLDKNNNLILTQKLENNKIKNLYKNKYLFIDDKIIFTKYNFSLENRNHLLHIDLSWLDNRGRVQNMTEYLIVINQNL